jgi:hypothetical protein
VAFSVTLAPEQIAVDPDAVITALGADPVVTVTLADVVEHVPFETVTV